MPSERGYAAGRQRVVAVLDRIDQRRTEFRDVDLEIVARLSRQTVGEGQRGRAEVMHVRIARPQELRVLEVVVFQVLAMGSEVLHAAFFRD